MPPLLSTTVALIREMTDEAFERVIALPFGKGIPSLENVIFPENSISVPVMVEVPKPAMPPAT